MKPYERIVSYEPYELEPLNLMKPYELSMKAAMPANQFLHALGFERCLKQHPFLKIILPLIVELLGQITSNLESDM